MVNIHDAVKAYRDRGWHPIPVKEFGKSPSSSGWQTTKPAAENFMATQNVGILLGEASGGLVDIDLDIPQARQLARETDLLAGLPTFGREGDLPGHMLVVCKDAPAKSMQFGLPSGNGLGLSKNMVLEIRGKGQTVFPPSRYLREDKSVQSLVWSAGSMPGTIPEMAWDDLQQRTGVLALLSVVLAAYPTQGNRDNTCMALAGTLVRLGVEADLADDLIVTVARLAGDEEADKRRGKARAAAERLAAGEHLTGLPTLLGHLGLEDLEASIRKWPGLGSVKVDAVLPKGAILVEDGNLNAIVDQAEAALIAAKASIYQRGHELVRAVELLAAEDNDGIRRRAGSTILMPADNAWLVQAMAKSTGWYRKVGEDKFKPVDPPPKYANGLRVRMGEWRFPTLVGIASTPTMARGGRVLQEPGFDPESGLLLAFEADAFPRVPENPTWDDARAAMDKLQHPLRGFPFADYADWSVAIAAILTGLIRPGMETAPLHAFDAPTAGIGKSLLTSLIGIIATGHEPAAMSQGKDSEEDEKRLGAALRGGDAVLLIDNCIRPINGDSFICSMLTQPTVKIRILGESKNLELPCRVLVMATGNNLDIAGDMTRRAVVCRLDAGAEEPEKRKFNFDCLAEARQDRGELVAAALTVLRAFVVAGRPVELEAFGSFPDYDLVRGALVWLELADPAASRERIVAADPARAMLGEVLELWHSLYGDRPMMVADLWSKLNSNPPPDGRRLRELLEQVGHGRWDAAKIGRFLKARRDRPVGGLVLRSAMKAKQHVWRVEPMATSSTDGGEPGPEGGGDGIAAKQDDLPF
jgi:hypothetical protein